MPDGAPGLRDRALRPALATSLRLTVAPFLQPRVPYAVERPALATLVRATSAVPRGVRVARETHGGVRCERIVPAGAPPDAVVLYLHGGGFCIGSPAMHRPFAARLALAAGAAVVVPDYALAPERPYPAALDDARAVYAALGFGYRPERIALAGDSAGGGLALALLLASRDAARPLPACAVLFSPWVDLTLTAASLRFNAAADPFLGEPWLARCARAYTGALAPDDARVSPLFADLRDLPPLAIHVGTREVLLDDAARLAARARAAGVAVELQRYAGFWHNAQLQAALLPSASRH